MALHPALSRSPYDILDPAARWFPADEALRATAYERLLPPLVARVRQEVRVWRADGYPGASPTSIALLRWWFETEHVSQRADGSVEPFRWYFAQREAVESVIWLYDVKQARDKFDLLRFDASGAVSAGMFPEDWPRYVVKMATGAGKTKVLSLLIAWSFFHRLYEPGSALARNFLLIAPNIIVLDRLRADFDGLRIFFSDPVLPDNGTAGRNWRDDFQLTLHLQDDVRLGREFGNLFLTNIHRVYLGDVREPSLDDDDLRDYFLQPFGPRPTGKTTDSKTDLGELIREIEELAVFNDEAHHIHDERMAWFGSIRDIHHRMLQKDDVAAIEATPRYDPKDKASLQIELTDFSVYYTQGAMDAVIASLREGKSQVVCDGGQLGKVSKSKAGVVSRDKLTRTWTDWVDYWAVDFDYGSRKEIVKRPKGMGLQGVLVAPSQGELVEWEDWWTGGYIFENEWQSFRTRQDRDLELKSAPHVYAQPGRYQVAVKVIDIFGNDTMTLLSVNVG